MEDSGRQWKTAEDSRAAEQVDAEQPSRAEEQRSRSKTEEDSG